MSNAKTAGNSIGKYNNEKSKNNKNGEDIPGSDGNCILGTGKVSQSVLESSNGSAVSFN